MKTIKAKSRTGIVTDIKVDDDDFDYLNQFTWRILTSKHTKYAARCVTAEDQQLFKYPTSVKMHREIAGILLEKEKVVDHKNHDGLDNQRENLRICDLRQNQGNRRKTKPCSSKYKGVCFGYKKWRAYIKYNGTRKELGSFSSEDDAAEAYNSAAIEYFGEFANINIIKK